MNMEVFLARPPLLRRLKVFSMNMEVFPKTGRD